MALTLQQRKRFHAALLDAFPSAAELAMHLSLQHAKVYHNLTPPGLRQVEYLNILVQADAEGWIGAFAQGLAEERPETAEFAALAAEIGGGGGPARPGRVFTDETDARKERALQRTVRPGQPDADARRLVEAMDRASRAVCLIEWNGEPQGTGFLVGPALVLTNWHVVAPLFDRPGAELAARFGYLRDGQDILRTGERHAFAEDWNVRSRAYDTTDETPDPDDVPDPKALDYALVRLAGAPAGAEPLALDPGRGLPPVGGDLILIQHPSGGPQKAAFGRVTALAGGGLRLRYDANTKPGSSGSPVLDARGALVALHHAGDANFDRLALFNQGIPIGPIAADIAAGD